VAHCLNSTRVFAPIWDKLILDAEVNRQKQLFFLFFEVGMCLAK